MDTQNVMKSNGRCNKIHKNTSGHSAVLDVFIKRLDELIPFKFGVCNVKKKKIYSNKEIPLCCSLLLLQVRLDGCSPYIV